MIDWLLDALPSDLLCHLEVYTFANAANHFNNPRWTCPTRPEELESLYSSPLSNGAVGHIEHYANSADVVSRIGVLHFVDIPNRYMGRLFVRPGSGHMLNQHYLDNMFTLGPDYRVLDSNPFMDMEVETKTDYKPDDCEETLLPISDTNGWHHEHTNRILRVKDFSRLWQYRNGGSPLD